VSPRRDPAREELYRRYLERVRDGEPYLRVAREVGIAPQTAWKWIRQAQAAGDLPAELAGGPERRVGGAERERRKDLLVRLVFVKGIPVSEAAKRVGISPRTAEDWMAEMGMRRSDLAKMVPGDPIPYEKLDSTGRRGLADFAFFRRRILGREHHPPWASVVAHKLIELYRSPQEEYVVVNAPPGVGKSTLITHDFVAWVVLGERAAGREPRVLVGHRAWSKSTWYVKRLRHTFTHNRELILTYGRCKPLDPTAPWSVEELLVEPLDWEALTEKEPTISAGSYDASLLSGRFTLVIWDDLIDKTNSATAEARRKLVEWNDNEAESRLEPGGLYVISNARYGPEDLSYTVTQQVDPTELDPESGAPRPLYKRIRFPAHDDRRCNGREHTGPWPDGCLLDPERISWARLRRFAAKDEGRYLLTWQQEDTDPAGFLAQRAWFEGGTDERGAVVPGCFDPERRFGELAWPLTDQPPLASVVTIDPSSSQFWAILHFLVYPDRIHVRHRGVRRPMQAPDVLYPDETQVGGYTGLLEDWHRVSAAEGVAFGYLIVEQNASQRWLMQYPFFQRWAASRGVVLIPHTTTRNAVDPDRGVEMLRPVYQFGKVRIPYLGYEERLLADAWRREACSWPEGQTKDLVMAHWFLVHRLDQIVAAEQVTTSDGPPAGVPSWARAPAPSWAGPRSGVEPGRMLVGAGGMR
jgi:hypothetical protein